MTGVPTPAVRAAWIARSPVIHGIAISVTTEIEGAVFRQTVDELGAVAGPNDHGPEMREAFGHNV